MPWRLVLTGCLIVLLGGCSSGYAPVDERSLGARPAYKGPAPSAYRVQRGDTLYSIAFRYGLDYRQVARWNGISSRDYIYPGQRLRLKPPTASNASVSRSTSSGSTDSASRSTSKQTASTAARPAATKAESKPTPKPAPKPASTGPVSWQWPHPGRILSGFGGGQPANKGIDIVGKAGDPVKAAATGVVVYSGNGLLGYGNLVILNHNNQYLSAYAHNSRIFVREGDKVKAGEKIAEVGSTGAARTMLHFEIRRDGNPVNPMRYLPKR
ncbi:peptidoglycan DD-metalloendopeptidase family protein [Marinobacterium alkalitolerans]|uniref:peptidoglycan DD-metalloendopeptidase family protein n=1 Tax=Marinobacterium alkalitolerans TaxID=1542925 RepID=UPI002E28239C|nr:peptidoglycan DD-metalloendopeptidase family protein [Marinobacterium alkalitolerans]